MKLCYRGVPYESNSLVVPTTETETDMTFLGRPYKLSRAVLDKPLFNLSGVAYLATNQLCYRVNFLGGASRHCPTVFMPMEGG
jgi:hypothetical protein